MKLLEQDLLPLSGDLAGRTHSNAKIISIASLSQPLLRPKTLLLYSADLVSLTLISLVATLSILPFFLNLSRVELIVLFATAFVLRIPIPTIHHNHGHLKIFRSKALNFLCDIVLGQLSGITSPEWELHHNRGHHSHFLDPANDSATTLNVESGKDMSLAWYIIQGNALGTFKAASIALNQKDRGFWLSRLSLHLVSQWSLYIFFLLKSPAIAIAFILVPAVIMRVGVWWISYFQHVGLPTDSVYTASTTSENRWINFFMFNVSHHTAHHEKPTLHWSLLPERTDKIKSKIPHYCMRS